MDQTTRCPVCGNDLDVMATTCPRCHSDFGPTVVVSQPAPVPIPIDPLREELVATLSGRFEVGEELGRGGMGLVFRGRDPALRRDVAIKVLLANQADDPDARQRFLREAQSAAAVEHPNVVPVFEVGSLVRSHAPYFVMQFVNGHSLEDALGRDGAMPERVARRMLAGIASALAAAHARRVVHRDIKPANILIDNDSGRALVADFGISATLHRRPSDTRLTQAGAYVGTPRYMSPEQVEGQDATDRSDVYSLGCVAFEMLTGHPVFEAASMMAMMAAHLTQEPPSLRALRADLDPAFTELIEASLSKSPNARPTAADWERALAPNRAELQWPPPGLGALRGSMRAPVRLMAIGGFLLFVQLGLGVLFSPEGGAFFDSVLVSVDLAALCMLGIGTYQLVRVLLRARVALRSGFPKLAVYDVLVDATDETAELLSATGAFAHWSARRRARELYSRRAQLLLLLALGPSTGLALLLVLAIGGRWSVPSVIGVPVLLVPSALVLSLVNWRAVWRRLREPPLSHWRDAVPHRPLVLEWAREWDRVAVHPARWANILVVSVTGAATLAAVVAASACALFFWANRDYGRSVLDESRSAATAVGTEWIVASRLAPVADSSLDPLTAGRLYNDVASYARLSYGFEAARGERLSSYATAPRWPVFVMQRLDEAFPRTDADRTHRDEDQIWRDRVFPAAIQRGLTASQLATLAEIAPYPMAPQFAKLAHARRVDLWSARFEHPRDLANEFHTWRFHVDLDSPAEALLAQAALHANAGRFDSAEAKVREVIGVASLTMNLPSLVDVRFFRASPLYRMALGPLRLLLARRGAFEELELSEESSWRTDFSTRFLRDWALQVALVSRDSLLVVVRDTLASPSLRIFVLTQMELARCGDPHSLFFGRSAAEREAFATARRSLARTAGDSAYVDWVENLLDAPVPPASEFPTYRYFPLFMIEYVPTRALDWIESAVPAALDRVAGGKRFRNCASRH